MESLLHDVTLESKNKTVDLLAGQQKITDSWTYNSVSLREIWSLRRRAALIRGRAQERINMALAILKFTKHRNDGIHFWSYNELFTSSLSHQRTLENKTFTCLITVY